ncbi:MAG: hypothetical protein ABIM21_01805 [candidate division WOR-3 bacterium]
MALRVLSPVADVAVERIIPLNPRPSDLNYKKIGLLAGFKQHWPIILREVSYILKAVYPYSECVEFQYPKDCVDLEDDLEYLGVVKEWLKDVDIVIVGHGDAGSCALFLAYLAATIEKLGKPAILLTHVSFLEICKSAAAAKGVPALRIVTTEIPDLSPRLSLEGVEQEIIIPNLNKIKEELIRALVSPLTLEEAKGGKPIVRDATQIIDGSVEEIEQKFYANGWTLGFPFVLPTEEKVEQMLRALNLRPDHIIAVLPPKKGIASAEKIAINAIMAGCLPAYMPIVIAAVKALSMYDRLTPGVALEGYTCSVASWAPLLVVSGLITKQLGIASATACLSPYWKPNVSIGYALSLVLLNIAGVRPAKEDLSFLGHEGRYGMCIAENEDDSPWEPLRVSMGFKETDNTVTLFWPNSRIVLGMAGEDPTSILSAICDHVGTFGFNPGSAIILSPRVAKILAKEGLTKGDVITYVVEYARRPGKTMNLRWLKGNRHIEKLPVPLPLNPEHLARRIFNPNNLLLVVAGAPYYGLMALYNGGGDHGGPVTVAVELPERWPYLLDHCSKFVAKHEPYYYVGE